MTGNFSVSFLILLLCLIACAHLMPRAHGTPIVNCSLGINDDKIFLESSTNIFLCQNGALKQRGCYIDTEPAGKQCVWLDELTKNVTLRDSLAGYKNVDKWDCTQLKSHWISIYLLKVPEIDLFRDCTQVIKNGETKYDQFNGNPFCNVKGMQTYNFKDGGWEKCDENGEFELKSCATITTEPTDKLYGQCVSKEQVYERIRNTPIESPIRTDNKPLCIKAYNYTGILEGYAISSACTFDSPINIDNDKKTTTVSITTEAPTISTTEDDYYPDPDPDNPDEVDGSSTTEEPTTSTTESTEEPDEPCENGPYYNVYYHKNKPTHCIFPNEQRSCLSIKKMNEFIPDYLPTGGSNWDVDKEKQISEKLQYIGKWQGGLGQIHRMKHGDRKTARIALDEYVGRLAYDEEEILFSDIGPFSYCNFLLNYFPLKNSILFDRSAEPCPSPQECDTDGSDENGSDENVSDEDSSEEAGGDEEGTEDVKEYPKPLRNVWYENDDDYGNKCYIDYVPGDKKCITLKSAMNLLSAINQASDFTDWNKKAATAAKMKMFNVTVGRRQNYNFDSMMQRYVHISDIVEGLNRALGFDDTDEYIDVDLDGITLSLGITSFCTIYAELIPIKFDKDYVDMQFHECPVKMEESDFPDSAVEDSNELVNYIPDSDKPQKPVDS